MTVQRRTGRQSRLRSINVAPDQKTLVLGVVQLARELGRTRQWVAAAALQGAIPSVVVGARRVFLRHVLEQEGWLAR